MRYFPWTNKQIARLKECYASMSKDELIAEFAPHPWSSIQSTAHARGIRKRDWMAVCAAHVMQTRYFEGIRR